MCTRSGSKAPSRGRQYRPSKEGKEKGSAGSAGQGRSRDQCEETAARKKGKVFFFFLGGGGFCGCSCLTHVSNAEHPPSQGTVATCSQASTRDISAAKAQEGNAAKQHSTA